MCQTHNIIKCFGNICPKCHPSTTIRSIDPVKVLCTNDPEHEDILMTITNSQINYDRYSIYSKSCNQYQQLFTGKLIGCGNSDIESYDIQEPRDIVINTESTDCETWFNIDPPAAAVYTKSY